MCGIGGIFSPEGVAPDRAGILAGMVNSLSHRGPDANGTWEAPDARIAMCHTRLAVLDLSPRGNQPMSDREGRGWITYNGEVYNYRELREDLTALGCRFISDTDTEVVLAACLQWGVEEALSRFNGMFAFAMWHSPERTLYLVRDRMGIKPLYYGRAGDDLVFGSELKALCVHPRFERALNNRSLELYLMLQYVPSPATIYRDAWKVPAGHFVRIDGKGQSVVCYWDPASCPGNGDGQGEEEGRLSELLTDSVRLRLLSDVPLGSFLSGGIDSALVVARMRGDAGEAPRTFTISYDEPEFDESRYASEVARILETDHTSISVSTTDLLSRVDSMAEILDEPLSDPSFLPMAVLSQRTRESVTVALSGDGGDELFGGYDRYRFVDLYHRRISAVTPGTRKMIAGALNRLPSARLSRFYQSIRSSMARGLSVENFSGKWEKLLRLLRQDTLAEAYQSAIGVFTSREAARLIGRDRPLDLPDTFIRCLEGDHSGLSLIRRMMDLDSRTFLIDDVLTKVDRASMAFGLEVRVPLLDHRIVSWARRAPDSSLFLEGRGKAPLRKMAVRQFPRSVTHRPKMGFTLPLDSWFRGPLKDFLLDHLAGESAAVNSIFDRGLVDRLVSDHLAGRSNNHEKLWNLLVFGLWVERWSPTGV